MNVHRKLVESVLEVESLKSRIYGYLMPQFGFRGHPPRKGALPVLHLIFT